MTDQEVLQMYTALVPFLANVCGSECEIVVHDVTNPEQSIIAIANSLTERSVGDPMTDLARNIQKEGEYKTADFLSNYIGHAKDKTFLSSTFFIKNEGRLIGLLCLNRDSSAVTDFTNAFQAFLQKCNLKLPAEEQAPKENLETPVSNILHKLVSETIAAAGITPSRMSRQEKIKIVQKLSAQGALTMKGAVAEIASQLKISEPTVYRYLNHSE